MMRSPYKPKLQTVPPEDVNIAQQYTFSLSLDNDTLCDKHKPKSFPQQYEIYISKLTALIQKNIVIVCYPEISKVGRLHVHGNITFQTPLAIAEFYLQLLNYPFALEIDTMEDKDIWQQYISKSSHILRPLCQKYKLPYEIQIARQKPKNIIVDSFNKPLKITPPVTVE